MTYCKACGNYVNTTTDDDGSRSLTYKLYHNKSEGGLSYRAIFDNEQLTLERIKSFCLTYYDIFKVELFIRVYDNGKQIDSGEASVFFDLN